MARKLAIEGATTGEFRAHCSLPPPPHFKDETDKINMKICSYKTN